MYDKKFMLRAIELAKKGIGAVDPNPLVGAVIVKDDMIVAEGYHHKYGDLHAERDCLKNLRENDVSAEGAEMYVTLEPCCHTGKQPPCTEAIVEAGIKRVYVGSDDPNELVAGKGIWYLREHGVEVVTHVCKEECDAINPVFFHYITTKTPYIVYKYAMTMDGKTATTTGDSQWISNEKSRKLTHEFRNKYTAIMTGINTVLNDNPLLTCRLEDGRNPARIICDSKLQIPLDSRIVDTAYQIPTFIATLDARQKDSQKKIKALKEKNVELLFLPQDRGHVDLEKLMTILGVLKINSILVEGGGRLAWSLLEKNYIQEIKMFIGPKIFGGSDGKSPVSGKGFDFVSEATNFTLEGLENMDGDIFASYRRCENCSQE